MPAPSMRRQLAAALPGGLAGGAAALAAQMPAAGLAASAALGACMAAIALEDALRLRVPDIWVLTALAAGLAWAVAAGLSAGAGIVAAVGGPVAAVVLSGGAFLALREGFYRLRGFDGLGLGDVKLAAAGGAWLGWEGLALAVLASAAAALGFVLVRVLRAGAWPASQRLAYGAFLAPAIWGAWYVLNGGGPAGG